MKKLLIKGVTIGADPEFFLVDKSTGKPFPACGLIGGTKENPVVIDNDGRAILEDNVLVEFNIKPVKSEDEWVKELTYMLTYLREIIPDQFDFSFSPSEYFDWNYLNTPQALTFGCEPDLNVYVGKQPAVSAKTNLRAAGGHIHIGYKEPTPEVNDLIVRAMDVIVTLPSLNEENDRYIRRTLYGKAGCHRVKPYGVEYRTLSSYYLQSEKYMRLVYRRTMAALETVNNTTTPSKVQDLKTRSAQIVGYINTSAKGNVTTPYDKIRLTHEKETCCKETTA